MIFLSIVITVFIGGYILSYIFGSPFRIIRSNDDVKFDLDTVRGGSIVSSSLKGDKYILYFTSPRCAKCNAQSDLMQSIGEDYDISVYAVIADTDKDMVLSEMSEYKNAFYDVIVDKNKELFSSTYAFILPHTALVDESGRIILDITGKISAREYQKIVKQIDTKDIDEEENAEVKVEEKEA